jgi:hypothetical protein
MDQNRSLKYTSTSRRCTRDMEKICRVTLDTTTVAIYEDSRNCEDKNPRARSFWEKVGQFIFVDRFHWINHKKSHVYCTVNCNPNSNSRLDGANTEVCEQSFRWFSRHKYSVNHMSPARFRFFMTLLADRQNEILIEKRGVFHPE